MDKENQQLLLSDFDYDLPKEFWNMDYFDFFFFFRKLMAESIRKYFEKL